MNTLTREQAIKRIIDIFEGKECDHITSWTTIKEMKSLNYPEVGAVKELMAIFDIKEEEIKTTERNIKHPTPTSHTDDGIKQPIKLLMLS